ncbi:META domain-containing protein [Chloroflexota bacterium]
MLLIKERLLRREKLRKVLYIVIALSLPIFLVTSCCENVNTKLDYTKWFLRSYGEENNLTSIIDGTEITATFISEDDRMIGSAGCNTYFANYEIDGKQLSINEMSYTEMACQLPEGIMEQEQDFLLLLRDFRSFEADGTTLTIFCKGGLQLYFTTATR